MEERVGNSRVLIALIIVGSVFLLTAGVAVAAGSASDNSSQDVKIASGANSVSGLPVRNSVTSTQHDTGSQIIAECIAALFDGVSAADVLTLRSDGYGFGEIAMAYFLARDNVNGWTVTDTLDLRDGVGMGWGKIFKEVYGSASHRDRNLGQIISGHLPIPGTVSVAAQRLAERVGTTDEQPVQDLLDQGAGYGTIIVAYKLADEFGVTPEWLVGERLAGAGWGQIKRGLSSSALTTTESQEGPPDDAGPPDNAGAKDHPDHPDHPDRPDNAGRKDKKK